MRLRAFRLMFGVALLWMCGCVTVGKNFRSDDLAWIVPGETSRPEVHKALGEPFRTGVDSGTPTWTYGYYKYRLLGDTCTKDLVIYYDKNGTVSSYTFNTSFPEEKDKWMKRSGP